MCTHRTSSLRLLLVLAAAGLALAVGACPEAGPATSPEALQAGLGRYRAATARESPDGAGSPAVPPPPSFRHLRVTVIDGVGVPEMDALGGDADPYITLVYGGEKRETAADEDTTEPRWHDSFVFPYAAGEPLAVSLWDDESIPQPDQLLGTVTFFPDDEVGPGERKIAFKAGENGTVRILLELLP